MLSDVVKRKGAVARHRSTLFAPQIDGYLDELQRLVLSFAAVLQVQRALCCAFHHFRMHLTLGNQ